MNYERLAPVAAGAAAGAVARWGTFAVLDSATTALVIVNLVGTVLLAVIVTRALGAAGSEHEPRSVRWLDFAATGFCGALTTFSSFAVDLAQRFDDGRFTSAVVLLIGLLVVGTAVFVAAERLMTHR